MNSNLKTAMVADAGRDTASPATRFSRQRFAVLVLAGVYPLVTLLLYAVLPLTEGWAIWQRTLVIAPVMVMAMVFGLIPAIQNRFKKFLNPVATNQVST